MRRSTLILQGVALLTLAVTAACSNADGTLEATALQVTLKGSVSGVDNVLLELSSPLGSSSESHSYDASDPLDGETLVAELPSWLEGELEVRVVARSGSTELAEGTASPTIEPLRLNEVTVRLSVLDGGADGGDLPADGPPGDGGDGGDGPPGDRVVPPDADPPGCLSCEEALDREPPEVGVADLACAANGPPSSRQLVLDVFACVCGQCGIECGSFCDPNLPDPGEECGGCVEETCLAPLEACEADSRNCEDACGDPLCNDRFCGPQGGTGATFCCEAACVDRDSDRNHCGFCGNVCPANNDCMAGNCSPAEVPPPTRQIAPMSTSITVGEVMLRWEASTQEMRLEVCADRDCRSAMISTSIAPGTTSFAVPFDATAPRTLFWRLTGASDGGQTPIWVLFRQRQLSPTLPGNHWGTLLDINRDGVPDLAVGVPHPGTALPGEVYVYLGSTNGPVYQQTLTGNTRDFGAAISNGGDMDGDGFADLVVSDGADLVIFFGGPTGFDVAARTPHRLTRVASGPVALAAVGDYNADGFGDIVVGDPSSHTATIYSGGGRAADFGLSLGAVFDDITPGFGRFVAGVGDVDGNGYPEVAIGNDGGSGVRFFSAIGPDLTTSVQPGTGFGAGVLGAGDVNGDGYPDMIVATPGSNRVYLYLGGPSGLGLGNPTSILNFSGTNFGRSLGALGDLDGDGRDDVGISSSTDTFVYLGNSENPFNASADLARGSPGPVAGLGDISVIGVSSWVVRFCDAGGCGVQVSDGLDDSSPTVFSDGFDFAVSIAGRSGG